MKSRLQLLAGVTVLLAASAALAFDKIELKDPKGDDFGPGNYTYPTDGAFRAGYFDLLRVLVEDAGNEVRFTVDFNGRITDEFASPRWAPPGNGFSHQLVHIYIDTDHKAGSGHMAGLPGTNVRFANDGGWEKCILIAPQGYSQAVQEVNKRAKDVAKDVIVPKSIKVKGKSLTFAVAKADLGTPAPGWGWQALSHSSDGLGGILFSRLVNEFNGQWRFGGGNDYNCDPHAVDILAGEAKGAASEKEAQKKGLAFKCDASDPDGPKSVLAVVPMVYR